MNYNTIFRQVYEPYLSKLGYRWYRKFFVRVDHHEEIISVVVMKVFSGPTQEMRELSVGAYHVLLGSYPIDLLVHLNLDDFTDRLIRLTAHKQNIPPNRLHVYKSKETQSRNDLEKTLEILKFYCPDIFEVGDVPDHLYVIDRISDRLISSGIIEYPFVHPLKYPQTFDTHIWLREFELAKQIVQDRYDLRVSSIQREIDEIKSHIKSLGNPRIERTVPDKNEGNRFDHKNSRSFARKEHVYQTLIDGLHNDIKTEEERYLKLMDQFKQNPEALRIVLENRRISNLKEYKNYKPRSF